MRSGRNESRLVVVFALGFFALVAQTLLFREFLTAFEGNELGIGAFFASWLVWVAIGALAGRAESRLHRALTRRFPLAALLYVPAFLLQHFLILRARALVGVQVYEVFPIAPMCAMSFLVNAPISFMTGFLFTRACRWAEDACAIPVARVYVLETLGSCAGGAVVTLLLARSTPAEAVFIYAAWFLAAAVATASLSGAGQPAGLLRRVIVCLAVLGLLGVALHGELGDRWAEANARAAWARLLPAETYEGTFTTAQARYLYGEREGQFIVVSGGGACETLPAGDHHGEIVAVHLAQKPDARDVLVFGEDSLGVCAKLKALPQIEKVTWRHPDPEYPKALAAVLAKRGGADTVLDGMPGVEQDARDIRAFARDTDRRYDLVILNLPDVTSLVLNRYATHEFFSLLKRVVAGGGVVSVRVSGGANYMGGELAYLGASMLETLGSVFQHVVLKPGDETWLIASDGDELTQSPAVLRDRFASIVGAAAVYPPEALLSLYPPDRVEFQMTAYRQSMAEAGEGLLANTDDHPKALLYGLLLALRQAGWRSLSDNLPAVLEAGVWLLVCPIALWGLLRFVFLLKSRRKGSMSRVFDACFLVFSTGFASMSLNIVLMFLYQIRFGSLFLDIGLVAAVFMAGAFLGSLVSERLLLKGSRGNLLPACLLGHFAVLLVVGVFPATAARVWWLLLFLGCGYFTGAYFPMAAQALRLAGSSAGVSGSNLELLDHLGGAAGALFTGLGMLPLFGQTTTLVMLALVVSLNIVPLFFRGEVAKQGDTFDRIIRPAGYVMFGAGACFLVVSQVLSAAQAQQTGKRLLDTAREMTGVAELTEEHATLEDGTALACYVAPETPDDPGGYVFSTSNLAPNIYGYGGTLDLAVYVERTGVLRRFDIISSNETPAYLDMLLSWKRELLGKNIFEPAPFKDIDAVSGATLTSDAIVQTLETAGRTFARQVLGKEVEPGEPEARQPKAGIMNSQSRDFLCLAALLALAVMLRYQPNLWMRRFMLAASLVATGVLLNLQYSTQQVMSLLSLNVGAVALSGPFFLVALVPLFVLLFGNVYCGYVCPFGAIQELVGDFWPGRVNKSVDKRVWRYARSAKYFLLLLVVILFAITRDYTVLGADPLITIFSPVRNRPAVGITVAVLILSVFFGRFWCRNLCPAGAFLSLFNGLHLLRRFIPSRYPQRCDMGVRSEGELDCVYCDRCAVPARETRKIIPATGQTARAFLAAVAVLMIVVAGLSVSNARAVLVTKSAASSASHLATAGEPRDVDIERIERLIQQQYLSDHEAMYYTTTPNLEKEVDKPSDGPSEAKSPQP